MFQLLPLLCPKMRTLAVPVWGRPLWRPAALWLYLNSGNCRPVASNHCVCVFSCVCSLQPSLPGSSVLGILQARILEWVTMPSSRGSSRPRDWTPVSYVSCHWQAGSLLLVPPGKPPDTLPANWVICTLDLLWITLHFLTVFLSRFLHLFIDLHVLFV